MLSNEFLQDFKHKTEARWRERSIDPLVYGFQFQPGTLWNPGLTETDIGHYQAILGIRFPHDLTTLLRTLNGTDIPMLNVYGSCDEPHRTIFGVYSYPRDIEVVKEQIKDVRSLRTEITNELADQGFGLPAEADLMPIYFHRYVLCSSNLNESVVLSINGADAVVYADCLEQFLVKEFLCQPA